MDCAGRLLTSVVVADPGEAAAIIDSERPVEQWKGFEARGLDQDKLAMLHALLTGRLFDEALGECGPLYAGSEEGPWLVQLPGESVARLAQLEDEALDRIGEELAATETFEEAGWPVEAVQDVVVGLAELAGVAAAQDGAIFAWMVPE